MAVWATILLARFLCRTNSITVVKLVPILRMLQVNFSWKFSHEIFTLSNTTRSAKLKQKRKELHPDQFHVGQICYNSTCVILDLPLSLCCCVCSKQKDIFNKKSSWSDKKQKYLDRTNRCLQLWDSSWATKESVSYTHLTLPTNREV